jgi:glycosyltransferase involved in cell wall biosynthesis
LARVDVSFVMPTYNEAEFIESALDGLYRAGKDMGLRYEIVVVDDGSLDDTGPKAVDFASRNGSVKNGFVKIVTYRNNVGKGYAVKTGFLRARGDVVVFVDGDLDVDVEQVGRFVKALDHSDIVVASKWHPESCVDVPLVRRLLSCGFNVLVRLLTGVRLRDTQTGLKAIRRRALEDVFPHLSVKRYAFDVEMLAVAELIGLKVIEMPVRLRLRGTISVREVWYMFVDLLGITYRLRVLRWYQRALKYRTL